MTLDDELRLYRLAWLWLALLLQPLRRSVRRRIGSATASPALVGESIGSTQAGGPE